MTWGQYFLPAGVVAGVTTLAAGMAYMWTSNTQNEGVAYVLPMAAFMVMGGVMSLSQLDKAYVAQEHQEKAARVAAAAFATRLNQLATQLYEEYLATASNSELIAYIKDRTPPACFFDAARTSLQ